MFYFVSNSEKEWEKCFSAAGLDPETRYFLFWKSKISSWELYLFIYLVNIRFFQDLNKETRFQGLVITPNETLWAVIFFNFLM